MSITLRGVRTTDLVENGLNPREHFDGLEDLAASIRAKGVLQPLIVNARAGRLIVTDGARRLRAARLAGREVVPCLVTSGVDEREVLTSMLAAAMHKELRPIEQAKAFASLQREHGYTTAEISRTTGYSQAIVRMRLSLLELPREVQRMVDAEEITLANAFDLARKVKAAKSGSTQPFSTRRSTWLTKTHPLADSVACPPEHDGTRQRIGGVGCGQCWEDAIRADERARIDQGAV